MTKSTIVILTDHCILRGCPEQNFHTISCESSHQVYQPNINQLGVSTQKQIVKTGRSFDSSSALMSLYMSKSLCANQTFQNQITQSGALEPQWSPTQNAESAPIGVIIGVETPISKCYHVEIKTNTGSILYGIQPDWLVPDKHIQLPDQHEVLPDRYQEIPVRNTKYPNTKPTYNTCGLDQK